MTTTTDTRTRADGWVNICARSIAQGEYCNLPYFYLSYKQIRVTIGPDGEPTQTPHVCRHASRED